MDHADGPGSKHLLDVTSKSNIISFTRDSVIRRKQIPIPRYSVKN